MATYSHYGDPSPEWEEFTRHNAIANTGLSSGQSIEDLQKAVNSSREAASAQYLLKSGKSIVSCQLYSGPNNNANSYPREDYL
jgi:hypothetical protein